jgi:hypothetical protein
MEFGANAPPFEGLALSDIAGVEFLHREEVKVRVWTNGFLHAKA